MNAAAEPVAEVVAAEVATDAPVALQAHAPAQAMTLAPSHAPVSPVGAGSVAGALGSLALVVGLIFALGWVAQRLRGLRAARGAGDLQMLGGVAVGNKERVVVLRVGEDHLVVGVAPGSVNLLHRYAGVAAHGAFTAEAAPQAPVPFADKLRDLLRKQETA